MSDDAEEKPPKLKLSKDVQPAKKEEPESGKASPESPASSAPKPTLKLDRDKAKSAAKDAGKDFDPDDPFGDILPKPPKDAPKVKEKPEAAPKKSLELDRTKWQPPEEKKPKPTTPPELPSKPAPRVDDGSGDKLTETLEKLPKDSPKKGRFPIASIAIILALILIIGAACGGIWFVLKGGDDVADGAAPAEPPAAETASSEPSGPIGKAREAVAKLEEASVEELADSGVLGAASETPAEESGEPTAGTATEPPPVEPAPTVEVAPEPREPIAPVPAGPSDAFKEQVSQFLSDSKIGGFRAGDKARVVLNGVSYGIGDEVEATTGLVFVGTKDGRLVFRDANGIYYVKSF